MKITNDQPIPFRVSLNETETADLLKDLAARFGPSLPVDLMDGRTFIGFQLNFSNVAGKPQTATGSLTLATDITAPAAAPAAPVKPSTQPTSAKTS